MGILTIRTRLMLILLLVSLLACGILSYLGASYGKEIISEEVTNQLLLVRNAKKSQIEFYLNDIGHFVEVMGQNKTVIQAAKDFKRAYGQLRTEELNADCNQRLDEHYHKFIDKLAGNIEVKTDLDLYKPKSLEGCYLQFEYIVDNPNPLGEKENLLNAEDGSSYTNVHIKYHEYFSMLIKKFNFYDVFLVDLESGDIVYSAYKETDFATNLYNGPYRSSNLADLARKLQSNADLESATWIDFASYRPSYGAPAAFVGVPLTDEWGTTVGGLCFQLPVSEINKIMTGNENWEQDGLGASGETYLVGEDFMMRSISRFYLQDTIGYSQALIDIGGRQEDVDRMYQFGTTILQQRIRTEGVIEALEGKSDVKIIKDYRAVPVISAYAPIELDGYNWVILSEKDVSEANQPVANFRQRMFIQTTIIVLLVTFLSMFLAGLFVNPIEKLTYSARHIIEGDTTHRVDIDSKDEFGELAGAFNKLVDKLEGQKNQINKQSIFNEELLTNFIPSQLADRLKKGEKSFADNYQNVSLVVIDIVGFSQLTAQEGATASVKKLNEIIIALDESAGNNYVEKIKTVGDSYFAACGLFQPRLDHAKRIVQFAEEAQFIIKQFNLNHRTTLKMHISLHSGDVVAGIVGENKYSFDVWGPTVNLVFRMNEMEIDNEIIVSEAIANRLKDFYQFEEYSATSKHGKRVFCLREQLGS